MVALTLVAGASPEQAAQQFFSQQGVQAGRSGRDTVNGQPAYTAFFEAATEQGALRGQVSFVSFEGKMFRILGYAPAQRFAAYQAAIDATIRSFGRLTDPRYLNVEPKRLALVNLDRQLSLGEFARQYPSTVKLETLGLINGVSGNQLIENGPRSASWGDGSPGNDPVVDSDGAVAEWLRLEALEADPGVRAVEKRYPAAQDDRLHVDQDLVEETFLEEPAHEDPAAHHQDVLAFGLLEPAHEPCRVVAHPLAPFFRIVSGPGEHVVLHPRRSIRSSSRRASSFFVSGPWPA